MSYFPWENKIDEDLARINKIPDSITEDLWKLDEGISCADWMPEDVVFELAPNSGIKLGDAIPNSLGICIVNDKLKTILSKADSNFEFFPAKIKNARGKFSTKKYFIANLIGTVHCMDMQASKYRMSKLDKGQAERITELVLDEEKIPEGKQIFRLGEMSQLLIVAKPTAMEIAVHQKCTGVNMTYLEDYGVEFRKQ